MPNNITSFPGFLGQYKVQLPDCRTQIVDYYVDEYKQYHADVKYEGEICEDYTVAHKKAPHGYKPAHPAPYKAPHPAPAYAPAPHPAPYKPAHPAPAYKPAHPAPYKAPHGPAYHEEPVV